MEKDYSKVTVGKVITQNKHFSSQKKRDKVINSAKYFQESIDIAKSKVTSRIFWGRSNFYKNISHLLMASITFVVLATGLITHIQSTTSQNRLYLGSITTGSDDLLYQGGSIQTVLVQNPTLLGVQTRKHVVKDGETLQSIADQYGITKDTIKWSSKDVMSPFTDNIQVGWELTIPNMNGVLYEVKQGQTLEQIIAQTSITNSEANRFNIIEFNGLKEPVTLTAGQKLFIPDGNLKTMAITPGSLDIPRGVFINPLSHSSCVGYSISRGFLSYHDGVDMAKGSGCIISAVANGIVKYAGWASQGQGYMVEIDHGGGITTKYFHGNGTYYIKTGDYVSQGQSIMYMGTTGFSTGVHLHFSLWKNGYSVNPYGYVPY